MLTFFETRKGERLSGRETIMGKGRGRGEKRKGRRRRVL